MTEVEIKELAREYINNCTKRAGFVILTEGIMSDFVDLFVAGFMKCLELNGGVNWHDLRKNPKDLPKDGVQVLSEHGSLLVYKEACFCWFEYSPNADNIKLRKWEEPIAWREIPKFKEAEE